MGDKADFDRLAEKHRAAVELEQMVLGSVFHDPACLDEIGQILTCEHLYEDAHKRIFAVLLDLHTQGKEITLVSVAQELIGRHWLDDIGGAGYLATLYEASPTAVNVDYYAGLVRDNALLRGLVTIGQRIVRLGDSPHGPAQDMLAQASKLLQDLEMKGHSQELCTLADAIDLALVKIRERVQSPEKGPAGLATGIADLDALTAGLHAGELIILAARPSIGKTACALALTRKIIEAGHPTFFASLEQDRVELATRLLCAVSGVDGNHIRQGTLELPKLDSLEKAGATLLHLPLLIDDAGEQGLFRIGAHCRRLKRQGKLSLVVVDYLQLIAPEDRRVPRHEQVGNLSRRLKALAKDLQVPLVCLAQLNRETENRASGIPKLSDLRESGSIEADADTVILLHRPPETPNQLLFLIAKQRNGPTGEVLIPFDRRTMRLGDEVLGGESKNGVYSPY